MVRVRERGVESVMDRTQSAVPRRRFVIMTFAIIL